MALISCPECSTEVSDSALKCVKCGVQLRKATRSFLGKVMKWGFIAFNVLMAVWLVGGMGAATVGNVPISGLEFEYESEPEKSESESESESEPEKVETTRSGRDSALYEHYSYDYDTYNKAYNDNPWLRMQDQREASRNYRTWGNPYGRMR